MLFRDKEERLFIDVVNKLIAENALEDNRPLRLLREYAKGGGIAAVNHFLKRLENKITPVDKQYIRKIYFVNANRDTGVESASKVAAAGASVYAIAEFARGITTGDANWPVAAGTLAGGTAFGVAYDALRTIRLEAVEDSQEMENAIKQISKDITPAIIAVANKIEERREL